MLRSFFPHTWYFPQILFFALHTPSSHLIFFKMKQIKGNANDVDVHVYHRSKSALWPRLSHQHQSGSSRRVWRRDVTDALRFCHWSSTSLGMIVACQSFLSSRPLLSITPSRGTSHHPPSSLGIALLQHKELLIPSFHRSASSPICCVDPYCGFSRTEGTWVRCASAVLVYMWPFFEIQYCAHFIF